MYEPFELHPAALPERHLERVEREVRAQAGRGLPADDETTEDVHDECHVDPAGVAAHVRQVGDPELVRPRGHKLAIDQVSVTMQPHVRAGVEQIPEAAWQRLDDYPHAGLAEIAETRLAGRRLVVRRTRLVGPQTALWPNWRHFAFITDRTEALAVVEREHRQHAVVELAIRDHKDSALRHLPSGHYAANGAWCVIAALAANLARWVTLLGLKRATPQAQATLRRRLLGVPGRLVHHGRHVTVRLPARWPWRTVWIECLTRLRGLPQLR